jgi:hypothetical protein
MKNAALFTFFSLSTVAFAVPSLSHMKRQSIVPEETIIDAINQWRNDIVSINVFLDGADPNQLTDESFRTKIGHEAGKQELQKKASDQAVQFGKLLPILGPADTEKLIILGELKGGGEMAVKLQSIKIEADKPTAQSKVVDEVNALLLSHCTMLSALDIFWSNIRDQAKISKDSLFIDVPRPKTRDC